jgi:hypothetical protein
MLMIAPLMRGHEMLRTWVAMFGASIGALLVQDVVAYIAMDAICAAIVMARPSGLAQKAIGALFVLMVMFDLGFFLSPRADWGLFASSLSLVGWTQWAILGAWAGHDAWGHYRSWSDAPDRIPAAYKGRVR